MKFKFSALLASAAIATGTVAPAHAAQVSGVCLVSDVTANGIGNATACRGEIETETFGNDVTGNDGNPLKDQLNTLFGTSYTWNFVRKDETNGNQGLFDGYASGDAKSGNWSANPALNGPFAISVKGGTGFAVYLFDNITQAVTSGTWSTLGLRNDNGPGNQPGISHISLFAAQTGGNPTPVPEPTTIFGLGLLASGVVMARRRRNFANN